MKRRRFLDCLALVMLAAALPSGVAGQAGSPPNIVLFLVDDMGWTDVGSYGSSFYETPSIDALAQEGVRFTNAYATCHVCSPSRASILTGKYPARLDLTDWLSGRKDFPFQKLLNAEIHQSLPREEVTLAETLKTHGYSTGIFGKWHLGEVPEGPETQGFDVKIPTDWNACCPRSGYYAPYKMGGLDESEGDYLTDSLTDKALDYIESNKDKPFFLYLSHFAVHDPIHGRPDLVEKYTEKLRDSDPPEGAPFVLEGNPDSENSVSHDKLDALIGEESYQGYRVFPNEAVKIKQHQDNVQFAGMVESTDASLGRVRAKLEELGLTENTIIIFASDNGGMSSANFGNPNRVIQPDDLDKAFSTSNLPLRGAKGWLYEGGIRVPMIVKWPGQGAVGTISDVPVTGTDFYPTILEMAGLPLKPEQHTDGVSLAPLVKGETALDRDAIYWHFPHYSNHGMQSPGGAIRSGDFKLLEYFENGTVQLFNLKDDIGETTDLAKSLPQTANALRAKLHAWRDEVGANMMPPNPDYAP